MFELLARLAGAARDFLIGEPVLALAMAGALAAVHLTTLFDRRAAADSPAADAEPLVSRLWRLGARVLWAGALVTALASAFIGLRSFLDASVSAFRFDHGRVSDANLAAVRTIWGDEQTQRELRVELGFDVEETERLEPEDPSMPAVLRKHTVHHAIEENPFVSAHHAVTLTRSARTKGSAVYSGYETKSRFTYALRNPAARDVHAKLTFPLPSDSAMYDDLVVKLDGAPVLDEMKMDGATLVLERDLHAGQALALEVSFASRGLSFWYFQVIEPRELRDFSLTLALPDLGRSDLNYPEGCMPPTALADAPDGRGVVLTWALDRAISSKGMGVALPSLPQPGETTSAVLGHTLAAWGLLFAALVLCLTLAGVRHATLVSLFGGALLALGYGLLADTSDLLWGFWPSAVVVLVPLFAGVCILVTRALPGREGKLLAGALVLFGLIYPCAAGLDAERVTLYDDLAGLAFLGLAGVMLRRRLGGGPEGAGARPG